MLHTAFAILCYWKSINTMESSRRFTTSEERKKEKNVQKYLFKKEKNQKKIQQKHSNNIIIGVRPFGPAEFYEGMWNCSDFIRTHKHTRTRVQYSSCQVPMHIEEHSHRFSIYIYYCAPMGTEQFIFDYYFYFVSCHWEIKYCIFRKWNHILRYVRFLIGCAGLQRALNVCYRTHFAVIFYRTTERTNESLACERWSDFCPYRVQTWKYYVYCCCCCCLAACGALRGPFIALYVFIWDIIRSSIFLFIF